MTLSAGPSEANSHHSWAPCDADQCPPEGLEAHSLALSGPDFSPLGKLQEAATPALHKIIPDAKKWGVLN